LHDKGESTRTANTSNAGVLEEEGGLEALKHLEQDWLKDPCLLFCIPSRTSKAGKGHLSELKTGSRKNSRTREPETIRRARPASIRSAEVGEEIN